MPNAIGYHTYAGGLAVGVAEHFDLVGLGEHDGYGDEIKALNFPGVPLFSTHDKWPQERGRGKNAGQFIFSNPPCAIFSVASAGRKVHWNDDPRLQYWRDIVRLLPTAQPDILAIESVLPAWTMGRELIDRFAATAAGWGYSTTALLHNARLLGAVQQRQRVFFVFHKIQVEWPSPNFDARVTVRDILKGVKVSAATKKRYEKEAMLSPHRRKLYEAMPNGGHLHKAFNDMYPEGERHPDGRVKGRPGFLTVRLRLDEPGPVFMGSGHILHPTEPRSLYPEEINAYTGFPKDWKWPDYGLAKLSTYASQGVSPLGGRWLGAGALASIQKGKRVNRPDYGIIDGLSREGWAHGRMVITDDPSERYEAMSEAELTLLPSVQPPKAVRAPRVGGGSTGPRLGSGHFIREMLLERKHSTQAIVDAVHEKFPGSKATASDVSWNRGKLRKEGVAV